MGAITEPEGITGLSEVEAAGILKKDGYNELPSQKKQSVLSILLNVLREPMLLLLLGAGAIYLLLGEPSDALMLLFFVIIVIGITFYQERKTGRALEALKGLSSPRALVIRDGVQKRIPGREVVKGDILVLREGDRVPADAVVLFCSNLTVDESLLTGESLAVRKSQCDGDAEYVQPGGDDLPFVYSGTLVVQGHGLARVTATGIRTELGKIGKALEGITNEEPILRKEINRLVKSFAIASIALCVLVVVAFWLTRDSWLGGILAGLSLAMSLLPEELPVILVVFFSMGAWRMSRRRVLTRRINAIETLGSATVLCVDKTGTLTMNRMILSSLYSTGQHYDLNDEDGSLPEEFHELLEFGSLASQRDPFDPIEKEIKRESERFLSNTEHVHKSWNLVREYPLSKNLLALSNVWESDDKHGHVIAVKGAPEAVADLCHFKDDEKQELMGKVKKMADDGLRILGVAKAEFHEDVLPDEQHDFTFEFIGLLGFVDPVRPQVADSLSECYNAGIRVIMITGDYPGTAQHIARQIGLRDSDKYITGAELSGMKPEELQEKIKTTNIFARVVPEQKLLIVNALKANGEVVAMTGDGVNDAPALKSSNIGIAMGERGTDVARESASIVLLNDDFSSIVSAVRLGRRIYDNIKKAIGYTFSIHVPIAGMALFPATMGLPLVLLPAHIAFLELIIDPACSTVFEAEKEEKNIMKRPPRNLKERLFNRHNITGSVLQGLGVFAVTIAVFLWALRTGMGEAEARTLTFVTLVVANIALIMANLSWSQSILKTYDKENRALWLVTGATMLSLVLILYVPALSGLFHFSPLHFSGVAVALVAGASSVLISKVAGMLAAAMKRKSA